MFARFTDEARGVVVDAQVEARRLNHTWIGCEHFLLALTRRTDRVTDVLRTYGVTSSSVEGAIRDLLPAVVTDEVALASIGIDLAEVRARVEANFGPGALDRFTVTKKRWRRYRRRRDGCRAVSMRRFLATGGPLPFTPLAKRCLEIAATSAEPGLVRARHLAAAVVSRPDTLAGEVLEHLRVHVGGLGGALGGMLPGDSP